MKRVYTQLPSAVVGLIGPWLLPFRSIDLINSRWRPEIDVVANGVIVIYFIYLLAKHRTTPSAVAAERAFKWSVAFAILLGLTCYFTKSVFIHWLDPEPVFLAPAHMAWAAAYVLFFLTLTRAVFFLLSWLTGVPPKPPASRR